MNNVELVEKLIQKIKEVEEKVTRRRLDMADQDGPNVSRYITATRWAVEQEIEALDNELVRLKNGLVEIKKLGADVKRYFEGWFVTDEFECLELKIISKNTTKGQEILKLANV
jgi:hypothetical protein